MRRKFRLGEAQTVRGRHLLIIGLLIFVTTSVLAVIINSHVFGHGFDVSRSISRYVGFEIWSAILFEVGNCFVAAVVGKALYKIGGAWRMSKIFYILAMLMCISLIWLSVFPIGMFDYDGHVSTISWLHILGSRTLFITMLLTAVLIARTECASPITHGASVGYIVYAVFCVVGHLTDAEWFVPYTLVFETTYIVGFLVLLLFCKTRTSRKIK